MKLAILIPTLSSRKKLLLDVYSEIFSQIKLGRFDAEIILDHRGGISTGRKRNDLMSRAKDFDYISFVDDDDMVSRDYIKLLFKAMESNPHVITFKGWMTTDGKNRYDWIQKAGLKWNDDHERKLYERFPNHLCCWKTALARRVRFPDITSGEDSIWAGKMNGHEFNKGAFIYNKTRPLFTKEEHIDEFMYHYKYRTKK